MAGPLVVITGASSGIGLALARAFAKEGNALLLIARHMKPVADLPAERTAYAEADVADYAALERAIRDAEAEVRQDRLPDQQCRHGRRARLQARSSPKPTRTRSTSTSRAC